MAMGRELRWRHLMSPTGHRAVIGDSAVWRYPADTDQKVPSGGVASPLKTLPQHCTLPLSETAQA